MLSATAERAGRAFSAKTHVVGSGSLVLFLDEVDWAVGVIESPFNRSVPLRNWMLDMERVLTRVMSFAPARYEITSPTFRCSSVWAAVRVDVIYVPYLIDVMC